MSTGNTKSILDLITTLGFILLLVLPFLSRKKPSQSTPSREKVRPEDPFQRPLAGAGRSSSPAKRQSWSTRPDRVTPMAVKEKELIIMEETPPQENNNVPVRRERLPRHLQAWQRAVVMKEILDRPKGW